ncbi:type II secretion system protein [Helicobacter sp. 23-1044]
MKRSGFSMIELVFVIVILGVLAAVAVPRFVATRTDAQVATARSDLASAQKAIVAKVFADNIDPTQSKAPDPNKPVAGQTPSKDWGDWIIEVAGLDGARWQKPNGGNLPKDRTAIGRDIPGERTVQPIGNTIQGGKAMKGGCGAILGIDTTDGIMVFAPNNSGQNNGHITGVSANAANNDFCSLLRKSYESSGGVGNKLVPLASTGTVEF